MSALPDLKAQPGCCEEASVLSQSYYIPCNAPAVRMIAQKDGNILRMCRGCADHNVKNRGSTDAGPYEGQQSTINGTTVAAEDYSAYAADAQAPVNSGDLLAQITRAVRELGYAQEDVAAAEAVLKAAQERVRQLEEFRLPELMREAGQEKLRTIDGIEVELTEKLFAAWSKANEAQAVAWLEKHGQGAIVQRRLELLFGRNEAERADEALGVILEAGLTPTDKQTVNPQTLAAVIRELLAEGVDVPLELLGAHVRSFVKVKAPKA